jgi:hypothetical protein
MVVGNSLKMKRYKLFYFNLKSGDLTQRDMEEIIKREDGTQYKITVDLSIDFSGKHR